MEMGNGYSIDLFCLLFHLCVYNTHKHLQDREKRFWFTRSEWSRIEHELTRERGLWGPESPSKVDKWMLDIVEGETAMYIACRLIASFPTLMLEEKREPGAHCSHMRQVPLVTCILLHYTKMSALLL